MRRPLRASRRAFTIVEVIVVVVIIAVLASVIAPRLIGRVGQAKHSTAVSNAASIANATKLFIADCGMPPAGSTIMVLAEKPAEDAQASAWKGPYVDSKETLLDPWGRQFILQIPGGKNVDFDIISYGADGKPGGAGEDEDVVKP